MAEALTQLNRVYDVLRLWTNHWQPVMKLIGKERVGAKLRKCYDVARTPYQRLRESRDLTLPRSTPAVVFEERRKRPHLGTR